MADFAGAAAVLGFARNQCVDSKIPTANGGARSAEVTNGLALGALRGDKASDLMDPLIDRAVECVVNAVTEPVP